MGFWDRFRPRAAPAAATARPTLAAVLEATLQLQADVRRLGGALVRAETQTRTLAERVTGVGAETREAIERLRRQQAESSAAAGRTAERLAEERMRLLAPFLDLADGFRRALRAAVTPESGRPARGGGDGDPAAPEGPGDAGAAAPALAAARRDTLETLARLADHLDRILRDAGLQPLSAAGMPFDPRLHRAVGAVARPSEWEGRVVLVDRQGYRLDGVLLRPAEVWVAVPADRGVGDLGAPDPGYGGEADASDADDDAPGSGEHPAEDRAVEAGDVRSAASTADGGPDPEP